MERMKMAEQAPKIEPKPQPPPEIPKNTLPAEPLNLSIESVSLPLEPELDEPMSVEETKIEPSIKTVPEESGHDEPSESDESDETKPAKKSVKLEPTKKEKEPKLPPPIFEDPAQRAWACSKCQKCEEFTRSQQRSVCGACGCGLIFHLKGEEEYAGAVGSSDDEAAYDEYSDSD